MSKITSYSADYQTQVSQVIQAAAPASSIRSKAIFTALVLWLLFITFSVNSNGSQDKNSAMTLMTSIMSPQILWTTVSSSVSPVSSANRPPMVSYDSKRLTVPSIFTVSCILTVPQSVPRSPRTGIYPGSAGPSSPYEPLQYTSF